jgi:hypothetical protein
MQFSANADVDVKASTIATQTGRVIVQFLCPAQTSNYFYDPKFRVRIR